ncbi:MAG TPA: acyl-CoA thioesterase [Kofleriaceae bacterium]|nr:acyl-CoA thioesterase [Kofleriaceae bacterium]
MICRDELVTFDGCDDGFLRGGKLLEWLDGVGAVAATRFAQGPVVLVAVDAADVRDRIEVGARVTMRARVADTTARSIGVLVTIMIELRRMITSSLRFVALDATGAVIAVPQLAPAGPPMRTDVAAACDDDARHELAFVLDEPPKLLGARRRGARAGIRAPLAAYVHKPAMGRKIRIRSTLHGGELMKWIEQGASMSAAAFAGAPVRLAAVRGLSFLRPVPAGVLVGVDAVAAPGDGGGVTVRVRVADERDAPPYARGALTYVAGTDP